MSVVSRRDRPSGLSRPEGDTGVRRDRPSGLSGPERRSSPRLSSFDYTGPYAYLLTINTARRQNALADRAVVDQCETALQEAADKHEFELLAYCFMPDHMHLLVQGSEDSRLTSFMKRFKQVSGFRYKQTFQRLLWQRSYYDRVLRVEDDLAVVADYIWNNPVRAGIVETPSAYPFNGPRRRQVEDRPEGLSLRREDALAVRGVGASGSSARAAEGSKR